MEKNEYTKPCTETVKLEKTVIMAGTGNPDQSGPDTPLPVPDEAKPFFGEINEDNQEE